MFTQGVSSTDESAIDVLFGVKTPGADNILGGKKEETEAKTTDNVEPGVIQADPNEVDTLLGATPESTAVESEPEKTTNLPNRKQAEPKKTSLTENQEVNYEAIYQDMVENGLWEEVEIPEGTEWSKELFREIQQLQVTAQYESMLDKTGPVGKQIIEHEKNGGNPSELFNMFREQKEIREFDITETQGQEEFLRAYLEAQGNSEKSIDRMITALVDQGPEALKEEAEEKKVLWDKQYEELIETTKTEQKEYSKKLEEAKRSFERDISSTIQSDSELTPKQKKELQRYILSYTHDYNGQQVSQFYMDMAEIQKDKKNYIELAKFVEGLKTGEYTKKIQEKVKKESTATSFLKIKNGAALKNSDNSNLDLGKGSSTFLNFLKNK